SWAKEDTRFPNTMVETLTIDQNGGASTLFAFTRGRGVWRVRLGGQSPACAYVTAASGVTMPAFGGSGSVAGTCRGGWVGSARSHQSWARLTSPVGGKSSGVVQFTATVNTELTPRSAAIAIADQVYTIRQDAADGPSGNDSIASATVVAGLPYVARVDTTGA